MIDTGLGWEKTQVSSCPVKTQVAERTLRIRRRACNEKAYVIKDTGEVYLKSQDSCRYRVVLPVIAK